MKYEIDINYLIANFLDGVANMSGKNKGLSTKLKVCAPASIYTNCYGHLLYLALSKEVLNGIQCLHR